MAKPKGAPHRLLVLRHAKSSWNNARLADHERPLSSRGQRAVEALADHLAAIDPPPTLVLCSTARRARDTLEPIRARLPESTEVRFEDHLYGASASDVLVRLRDVPEETPSLLLVGHNPTLEDLVKGLGRDGDPEPHRPHRPEVPHRRSGHAGLQRAVEGPRLGYRHAGGIRGAWRPEVIRPGRAAVAVVLLASLFVMTALIASSSSPSRSVGGKATPPAAGPEVLARYGAPPLPADLRRRVQAMFDVRSPGAGQLSPDGTRLFFNWSVTGTSQVWRIDGPQRFPVQLSGGEDPTTLQGVMPDGRHIVVARDRGGAENPGLYLQAADGGPLETIFQKDGVRAFLGHISRDGSSIFYTANDRQPDSYAVYRYDVAGRRAELVFGEAGLWSIADRRPDGLLLLAKATGNTSSEYFGYDPATRALTPYLGQGEREDYDVEFGLPDGELVVRTPLSPRGTPPNPRAGNFQRLYRYRIATRELVPVSPELSHDVDGFSVNDDGGRILYTVNEGGYTRLHAVDARTSAEIPLPALPAADHVSFGSSTRDGRYTAVLTNSATALPSSSVLDWASGRLTQWHVPSAPEIDPSRFAAATLESYPARDGTPIPMFVRRPASCPTSSERTPGSPPPCPVVVEFHGGPESQAQPGFDPGAQLFVNAGFIHVTPNVRGSAGYGKAWLDADNGPRRLQVITDIEDCARFIRDHWGDGGRPPKIGITGVSYGGYSTLAGMTMFAGAYDAGVAVVGMSNLATFLDNTAAYRRSLRITEYGDPEKDADALRRLSPISYIDRVQDPLLIIQGANDPRVPVSEALQMQAALDRRRAAARLILFGDEGHGAQKRDNRVQEVGHTLQFFSEHLLAR